MSHIDAGPLAGYNSLLDPHLSGYFSNTRMKRHLHKSGLVTKTGHIVSESTFRLNMAKKEHKKHVRELLAQAIVHKTLDMERMRQVNIKKKLEEIAKIELVQRVRGNDSDWLEMIEHLRIERTPANPHRNNHTQTVLSSDSECSADLSHHGDEDILPLMTPKGKNKLRPSSVPLGKIRHSKRPISAPAAKTQTPASTHSTDSPSESTLFYVESDGTPVALSEEKLTRGHGKGARSNTVASFRSVDLDDKHLYALDQHSLREITMGELTVGGSPYLLPLVSPVPPSSGHPNPARGRRNRRVMHPTDVHGNSTNTKNGKGTLMLHRQEPAMKHQERVQTLCDVTMHYFGSSLKLDYERLDPRDEVIVEQQHCGGNTLFLFREKILPRSDFTFTSRRHRGYPYSLTFYINGKIDCRVSTCCEYKHAPAARLGGRMGHFGIVDVEGAAPCYKCQINNTQKNREKKPVRRTKRMSQDEGEHVDVDGETKVDETKVDVRAMLDHDLTERSCQLDEPVVVTVEDDGLSVNTTPAILYMDDDVLPWEQEVLSGRDVNYSDDDFETDDDDKGRQSSRNSSSSHSSDSSVRDDIEANKKRPQSPSLTADKSMSKSSPAQSVPVAKSIDSDVSEHSLQKASQASKRSLLSMSSQLSISSIKSETSDHPVETSDHPVETSDHPVETSDHPVETSDHPVETSDHPVETSDHPVETSDHPVETSDHPVETANTVNAVANDDRNDSDDRTKSVTSSSEDSEFTNDAQSHVSELTVGPEEMEAPKAGLVSGNDSGQHDSGQHDSGHKRDTLKVQGDTLDGIAETTSSMQSVGSEDRSRKSSITSAVNSNNVSHEDTAAASGGTVVSPQTGDGDQPSTDASESKSTTEEEKSMDSPPDQSLHGDTVGTATAENTLHTEVAEEMQKVLQKLDHKDASDLEASVDSSEDSSEDSSSSSEDDSDTEDETSEKDNTEPKRAATDTPPEGSIASLVAGKRQVSLKDVALNENQMEELLTSLKQTGVIESLTLSGCQLNRDDLQKLMMTLAQTPSTDLVTLDLSANRLDATSVEPLLKMIRQKTELDVLVLQDNPLTDEGVQTLVEGLLDINDTNNSSEDVQKLQAIKSAAHDIVSEVVADVIKNEPDVSSGGSSDTLATVLVAKLEAAGNLGLRALNLANVEMGDKGAEAVARLIAGNTQLSILDLSGNTSLSSSSWRAIAGALKINRTITTLALNHANLADDDVAVITDALAVNTMLTSIELAGNSIGEMGGAKILEMLNMNSNMTRIEVRPGNPLSDKLVQQLKDRAQMNAAG